MTITKNINLFTILMYFRLEIKCLPRWKRLPWQKHKKRDFLLVYGCQVLIPI